MKILLFTLEYPPFKGGVANYYEKIVKFWPSKNIFVLNNNDNKLINNKSLILKWLPSVVMLYTYIKKNNIKHVIVGNLLPLGTATLLVKKLLNIKYTVILHGTDMAYANKLNRKKYLAKIILNNSENIIVNSNYVASLVKEGINKKFHSKINIVNPGVDLTLSPFGKLPSAPLRTNRTGLSLLRRGDVLKYSLVKKYNLNNKIILFSIGRLIRRKGIDKTIEVLPEIIKKYSNLLYVVAGTGPDEEYLKNSSKDLKNNIYFLGKISEEEKWVWMDLMDIFIQPVREEKGNFDGFGIVYLEANSFSRPVIAGDSGGVNDAVQDNVSGLLINPYKTQEIKNAILKLVDDKDLRLKLGEQGRERLKKFNSKDKVKEIYEIIYSCHAR